MVKVRSNKKSISLQQVHVQMTGRQKYFLNVQTGPNISENVWY